MWRIMYFTMHVYILGVGEQEEEEEEETGGEWAVWNYFRTDEV